MTVPPAEIDAGVLTLCAYSGGEARDLFRLVAKNIDHLRPWMPWASSDAAESDLEAFVRRTVAERAAGQGFGYWMREAGTAELVGSAGLHGRVGPGAFEIHCDEANEASAGVPRRLGFRLDRVADSEREAPGESGRELVWVVDASTWLTGSS